MPFVKLQATALFSFLLFFPHIADAKPNVQLRYYGPRFGVESLEYLGSGTSVKYARRVEHTLKSHQHLSVLKKLRRRADVPREVVADCLVAFTNDLRKDRQYKKRFGPVVLETISPAPGVLLQAEARGREFQELRPRLQAVASAEVAAAASYLEKKFPGFTASRHIPNYRFDGRSGKITAIFDILSDTRRQPYSEWDGARTGGTGAPKGAKKWEPHIVLELGSGCVGTCGVIDNTPAKAKGLNKVKFYANADAAERYTEHLTVLREDAGNVIPRVMSSTEAGVGRRSFAFVEYNPNFLPFESLTVAAQRRAKQSMQELHRELHLLGVRGLDVKASNMVFKKNGEVGFFFDPIWSL